MERLDWQQETQLTYKAVFDFLNTLSREDRAKAMPMFGITVYGDSSSWSPSDVMKDLTELLLTETLEVGDNTVSASAAINALVNSSVPARRVRFMIRYPEMLYFPKNGIWDLGEIAKFDFSEQFGHEVDLDSVSFLSKNDVDPARGWADRQNRVSKAVYDPACLSRPEMIALSSDDRCVHCATRTDGPMYADDRGFYPGTDRPVCYIWKKIAVRDKELLDEVIKEGYLALDASVQKPAGCHSSLYENETRYEF